MSVLFRRRPVEPETRGVVSVPWDVAPGSAESIDEALRLVPVYSAVSLISDMWSVLPVHGFGPAGQLEPQPALLTSPGVNGLSRFDWTHQMAASLLLRGNAYGVYAGMDNRGRPSKVVWLHPDRVQVDESGPRPVYRHGGQVLDSGLLVHVRAFVVPGSVVALSPIGLFRTYIEGGLSQVDYERNWFRNGAAPSAILQNTSKTMTQPQADQAKARFRAAISRGDLLVVGSDWSFTELAVTKADAQFLEAQRATANQVAAMFRVRPEEIGGEANQGSLTYSTVELNQIFFNQRTLMPWTTRAEAALGAHLLPGEYLKYNLDALARADLQTRMTAYALGLVNGIYTQDEVRRLEDRPPLTAEQKTEWQALYKGQIGGSSKELAEQLQKIYLAVGKVITADEARAGTATQEGRRS